MLVAGGTLLASAQQNENITSGAATTYHTVAATSATFDSDSSTTEAESASSDSATTQSVRLLPVKDVHVLNFSSEWKNRFEALGIDPESFLVADPIETSEEDKESLNASRHYFMGWYHLELGQTGRAIEQFNDAIAKDPNNVHILLDAARASLTLKEFSEARGLIGKVLDAETTNVEALRLKAETDLGQADSSIGNDKDRLLDDAVKALEEARKLQPNNLEVLRSLAKTYVQQQAVDKVIGIYREIVKVDPKDTYSLLILAQILSRMDRSEEAIEFYQRVIDQRRGFVGGYIYLGQLYERLKRYTDALSLYKQAILVEPRNVDLLRRFEDVLRQVNGSGNSARVVAAYKKFAEEYPQNTEVRRIYAERLEGEDNAPEAIKQYEYILKIDPENTDTLLALGKLYSKGKDYNKAAQYLAKAVEINPDKTDLYDAIASTYISQNNKGEAVKIYQKAITANPNVEKLYISLAALLEDDGKTTEAVTVVEQAVAKTGEKPELLAVLGKFYKSQKQTDKARSVLRKAYDQETGNLPLFGELLSLYLDENNIQEAEAITSKTASGSSTPKDVVLTVAAEFYFNAGRMDQATELYTQALEISPTKLEYLARLVGITNRQKLYDQSSALIKKYGPAVKDQLKVQLLAAEVDLNAKRFDAAIETYKKLLRENPLELSFYQYLIDAYNEADRYKDALDVVKQANEKLGKKDADSRFAISMMNGMVYYKNKKYAEAERVFQELIEKSNAKNDDVYYFLGSVYLDQDKFGQAEKQFRKAIDVNPNSANALNALGYMFADRGVKLEEAKDLISKALDVNPTAPHILDSMGWVLFKTGDFEGAEEYIERASRHFEDAEILDHLGQIYEKQGKNELAREVYKRALELEPTRNSVKDQLDKLNSNGTN